jgi:hypothetical protein
MLFDWLIVGQAFTAGLPRRDHSRGWTVLLSVVAHGVTANPLVKRIAVRPAELAA